MGDRSGVSVELVVGTLVTPSNSTDTDDEEAEPNKPVKKEVLHSVVMRVCNSYLTMLSQQLSTPMLGIYMEDGMVGIYDTITYIII